LVKGAVALFNRAVKDGRPIKEAFGTMSYPVGRFVYGDLYINAYDFSGVVQADGEQPGLIGSYRFNVLDRNGEYPVRKLINAVKKKELGSGVWIEFERRNATKRTYVERVQDRDGNQYVISCGYYPDVSPTSVVQLVRRGYEFLKKVGLKDATYSFTDVNDHTYNYGGTYLIVYTLTGDCLADGGNPENVGKNFYKTRDEDERLYVQDMIQKARRGGGWVNTRLKNSLVSFYVMLVQVGPEEVIITSSLFPVAKRQRVVLLVKSAVEYLKEREAQKAFSKFVKADGRYVRGDLELAVFDSDGVCYAYGDDRDVIWRNLIDLKDDDGRPFVKIMINTAYRGPGTVQFTLNGCEKVAYVENVEKSGKLYTISSSFYL
jgi:signal transduction histidine kinase